MLVIHVYIPSACRIKEENVVDVRTWDIDDTLPPPSPSISTTAAVHFLIVRRKVNERNVQVFYPILTYINSVHFCGGFVYLGKWAFWRITARTASLEGR
jgi:hypothetical protein